MNATVKQIQFIESLLKRISKARGTNNLVWLRENYKNLSKEEASSWIDTLRQIVREINMTIARYSVNGIGQQI